MLNITVNHKFCSKHNHLFATNILMLSAYELGIVLVFQECFCKVLVPWMGNRDLQKQVKLCDCWPESKQRVIGLRLSRSL